MKPRFLPCTPAMCVQMRFRIACPVPRSHDVCTDQNILFYATVICFVQKLALTSPTSDGLPLGIVGLRTKGHGGFFVGNITGKGTIDDFHISIVDVSFISRHSRFLTLQTKQTVRKRTMPTDRATAACWRS
jgi:hypothetical protein